MIKITLSNIFVSKSCIIMIMLDFIDYLDRMVMIYSTFSFLIINLNITSLNNISINHPS